MRSKFYISKAQKDQYLEEGFFVIPPIVGEDYLELLRTECDYLIEIQNREMDRLRVDNLGLSRRNSRYFVFLAYKERPRLGNFIFSQLTAEICRATIGDTAYLFWEQFVAKGMEKRMKELFPQLNLLFLDADAGVSEVNFFNRMHFFINHAKSTHGGGTA